MSKIVRNRELGSLSFRQQRTNDRCEWEVCVFSFEAAVE